MSGFTISLLLAPVIAVGVGVAVFWLTGWMDRREQRRHTAAE